MRKEWNIETVNITPPAPKSQKPELPITRKVRFVRFVKKHWRKTLLIALCVYLLFFLFGMSVSEYYIDENGVRQPIVLSMEYLAAREDYRKLRSHYDAIEDLILDITATETSILQMKKLRLWKRRHNIQHF